MENKVSSKKITKRKVFYVSGYDPRGVRFYYQNLKGAIEKFTKRDAEIIIISQRHKISDLETSCTIEHQQYETHTDYSFLHWDDLIKKTWIRSSIQLFLKGLQSYWQMFLNISWRHTLKLSRAPVITLLYPFLSIIGFPVFMSLLGSMIYADYGMPIVYLILFSALSIKFLPHLNALWLLRFFIFNVQNFVNYNAEYDQRAQEFARIIKQSFDMDYDEIILIAHSNGSIATMPILDHLDQFPEKFKILTLGHCIPLITMNTQSHDYLSMTKRVSQKKLTWYDIGFPSDGACYARTHPFHSCLYSQEKINLKFLGISPQFFKYYAHDDYIKLRQDKFNLHFSYLVTHDYKSATEFVNILTQDLPLESCF